MCREFDAVLAVSEEDRAALADAAGAATRAMRWSSRSRWMAMKSRQCSARPMRRNMLHIGTMYWPPNIDGITWFVEQVLPLHSRRAARQRV